MSTSSRNISRVTAVLCRLAVIAILVFAVGSASAAPVYVEIYADQDRSSPDPLEPFDIRFIVYANGNRIQGMVFGLILRFSAGNFIGTIEEWPQGNAQVVYSAQTKATFASIAWNANYGKGTDPDTMLLGLTSFSTPWTGAGELFRIHVSPTDTGSLEFDSTSIIGPAHGGISALDPLGASLPVVVITSPLHVPPQPDPVRFRISTSSGTDTLFFGVPGTIYFNVDAAGNEIAGLTFGLHWMFSNGNFVGPFSDVTGEVQYSPTTLEVYEATAFNSLFAQGTDPDTSLLVLTDFGGERFSGSAWIWSVTFQPTDTGTVFLDSNVLLPPAAENISAWGFAGAPLPATFIPGRIVVVPCPYDLIGDVNQDAVLTSSDLIYFVNYVFKSGPDPLPHRSVGDVNCSGGLGSSDIIYLVNHVFKGGAPPCACIVRRL